jgi:hypothetical protein
MLHGKMGLKLRRRQVAERGVKPFLIVDFLQKLLDACFGFRQIPVFVAMNFFILERFHERFAGRVGRGRQLHRMTTMAMPSLKSSIHTIR